MMKSGSSSSVECVYSSVTLSAFDGRSSQNIAHVAVESSQARVEDYLEHADPFQASSYLGMRVFLVAMLAHVGGVQGAWQYA